MDGYSLTDKLRKARRKSRLTAVDQALYYELVALCNESGWEDIFECSNLELCLSLNVSENTISLARINLINAGLISYKSGKGRRSLGRYSFDAETFDKPILKVPEKKVSEKVSNSEAFPDTFIDTLPKKEKKKKAQPDAIQMPFASDEFISTWNQLASMPKWKKKLPLSLQTALNNLKKYDEEFSIMLMRKAIEGNYQGVTFPDTDTNFARWKAQKGKPGQILQPTEERKNKLLEKFA